jgi:hypothetical protein
MARAEVSARENLYAVDLMSKKRCPTFPPPAGRMTGGFHLRSPTGYHVSETKAEHCGNADKTALQKK